jgi:hypothetical protein
MPISRRHRAVTVALLLPHALAGCSSGATPNHPSPPTAAAVVASSSPSAKVGFPFRNGSFRVIVSKVTTNVQKLAITNEGDGAGIKPPTPQNGQFVVVSIVVKNVGNAPAACSAMNSRLVDSAGKTYTSSDLFIGFNLIGDQLQTGSDMQPDATRSGLLIFDVPSSLTTPTTLIVQTDAYVATTNAPTAVSLLG